MFKFMKEKTEIMNQTFLLLGGNLGERFTLIEKAKNLLKEKLGKVVRVSSFYETEPWGFEANKNFLNQVILVETAHLPEEVLNICLSVENELGRERTSDSYSSRTMDIDILFFNNEVIKTKKLIIPHPRLHERRFTLEPLTEIAPDYVHPVLKKTVQEILQQCNDDSEVKKL